MLVTIWRDYYFTGMLRNLFAECQIIRRCENQDDAEGSARVPLTRGRIRLVADIKAANDNAVGLLRHAIRGGIKLSILKAKCALHSCRNHRIVRHHDKARRQFPIQLQHEVENAFGGMPVEISGRLVRKDARRFGHQGPC